MDSFASPMDRKREMISRRSLLPHDRTRASQWTPMEYQLISDIFARVPIFASKMGWGGMKKLRKTFGPRIFVIGLQRLGEGLHYNTGPTENPYAYLSAICNGVRKEYER
jgi:hypothetical protein